MKKSSIILLVSALILSAGMLVAGCVSDSESSASETTMEAGPTALSDMAAGNMTGQPPEGLQGGNITGRPPGDMPADNMTGERPEGMPGGNMTGPRPSGTPPETPSS